MHGLADMSEAVRHIERDGDKDIGINIQDIQGVE
jgi:hypothetical protein